MACLLVLVAACGDAPAPGSEGADEAGRGGSAAASDAASVPPGDSGPSTPFGSGSPPTVPSAEDEHPQLAELRDAIERVRLPVAKLLLDQLQGLIGVEEDLLRARVAVLEGQAVEALAAIERAKVTAPRDPRVFATAGEIYVMLDRQDAAELEVHHAAAVAFDYAPRFRAPVERARGFLAIHRQGQAKKGLEYLELALELDPDVPFVGRPLFQVHRLLAREALAAAEPALAERHALAAQAYDPHDLQTRLLLADARLGQMRFDEAISIHEELRAEGRGRVHELAQMYKRGGFAALLGGNRAKALRHFARARELGLSDEELGSAATTLRDEFTRRYARARELYEDGQLEPAERFLRQGLAILPDSVEGHQTLGVILFRAGRYRDAAEAWATTLALAEAADQPLYEPVHLDLARAWHLAEDDARARDVLDAYLAGGDTFWLEQTQEMIARLEQDG